MEVVLSAELVEVLKGIKIGLIVLNAIMGAIAGILIMK